MSNNICSGIYQIKNIINNKVYYGSTNNLNKRKREHFCALKNNTHCNKHLQRSYNKYGEENFIFEMVELCDENKLLEIEQKYLDKYFDGGINCYNEELTAGKPPSRKGKIPWNKDKTGIYSEETKLKMSNAKKGKKISEKFKQKLKQIAKNKTYKTSKKVLLIEKNIIFKSINEASRATNIDRKNISRCCNGERKTAGGYHWEFV